MKINSNKYFIFDNPQKRNYKYYIKYILLILLDIFYRTVLYFSRSLDKPKKYNISFCAIFKNEASYLKEWIEFHLLLGVDHFYLYNNNSTDDYQIILRPYIERGVVTLIDWPEIPGQLSAYKNWYKNYKSETTWVSFIDIDEFFCPYEDYDLKEWIKKYENYPVLLIFWKMFGTSGKIINPDGELVIEQYINCWDRLYGTGKLFYNTNYDISQFHLGMMHNISVKVNGINIPPMTSTGAFLKWNILRYLKKPDIQLNHYWSKSYNNYISKHSKGSAAYGKSWKTFEKFLWHENHNNSSDYKIYSFLIQLKLKIGNLYPDNQ